ncbi:GH25 family lysozyme [Merdibacter massiliensis]|uniref:GH25 family lysozyme n=1 Tax=Merdibacter massiliensis TaxID=1871030 RepID=UPI00137B2942|nr:GH25 family lysozyme [Merdibacter massiliensis]
MKKIGVSLLAFFMIISLGGNFLLEAKDTATENGYGEASDSIEEVEIVTEDTYVPVDPEVSQLMENVAMGSSMASQPMLMSSGEPYWQEDNGIKSFYDGYGNLVYSKGSKKVIDVSEHNGKINWEKVKASGVDGVIIRLGWGYLGKDNYFDYNISECNRLGIPYGLYLYSYAYDANFAYSEANGAAEMLEGVDLNLSYPFYYDIEKFDAWDDDGTTRRPPTTIKAYESIISTFITTLAKKDSRLSRKIHVYSYRSYLTGVLNSPNIIYPYVSWAAEYGPDLKFTNNNYSGPQGWQYSSSGSVSGISGRVDMNCFSDQFYNKALTDTLPSSIQEKLNAQKLTFSNGYVSGFALGSDISTLSAALSSVGAVTITNASGNVITSGKVATGQTITVTIQDQTTGTSSYAMQVVIRGDLNGDGNIGATDLYKLKMHIINKGKLSGANLEAAKLANNSAGATSLLKIKNDIIGKEKIKQ